MDSMLTLRIILFTCLGNISCSQFRRAAIGVCDHSLESVKEGVGCPVNKSEWEKRAQDLQCETYSQNCTDKSSFVYHCLINPWANGTIEVCAPRIKIFDKKCAEFNIGGARVQTIYKKTCQSCPQRYYSSNSYKYQECYKLDDIPEPTMKKVSSTRWYKFMIAGRNQNIWNTTNQTRKKNIEYEEQEPLIEIIIPVCIVVIIVLLVSIVIFLQMYRRRKRNVQGNENFIEDITNVDISNETEVMTSGSEVNPGNENFIKDTTNDAFSNKTDEVMTSGSEDKKREVHHLHMNTDLMKYICKMEDCKRGIDGLKEQIRQSPYYDKYADYIAKKNPPVMSVTRNWREDIGIQAAAEIFNIKIYVVRIQEENKITLFLPKDTDAERWMKVSTDKESRYNYLSDCDTCNEEEAKLLAYDDVYEMHDQDSIDKEDDLLKDGCSINFYNRQ